MITFYLTMTNDQATITQSIEAHSIAVAAGYAIRECNRLGSGMKWSIQTTSGLDWAIGDRTGIVAQGWRSSP